jgi:hypothetical protein
LRAPPVWSEGDLDAGRAAAEEHFRQGRHTEPLEVYLDLFDQYHGLVEEVLEQTVDLTRLHQEAPNLLADEKKQEIFRYLSGPPVSLDDLKVLVQARSLAPARFASDPELTERLVAFMQDWHDRRRFPWVAGKWAPEEHERKAAILATTALLAMRRTETLRRTQGSELQEQRVAANLRRSGFEEVPTGRVSNLSMAPKAGQFRRESLLGTRKADFVIGLWDGRIMALECKVSNSSTNSVKRLNNDAAVKAVTWQREFGTMQIVTAAILEGVYALRNLADAQANGLTIFWAHELNQMLDWIHGTKAGSGLSPG